MPPLLGHHGQPRVTAFVLLCSAMAIFRTYYMNGFSTILQYILCLHSRMLLTRIGNLCSPRGLKIVETVNYMVLNYWILPIYLLMASRKRKATYFSKLMSNECTLQGKPNCYWYGTITIIFGYFSFIYSVPKVTKIYLAWLYIFC